jgi:hypothetical protein
MEVSDTEFSVMQIDPSYSFSEFPIPIRRQQQQQPAFRWLYYLSSIFASLLKLLPFYSSRH